MKTVVTMNSRRFGAYEASSYFIDVSKDPKKKIVRVFFINDENPVESCELAIEADVIVNIATVLQSDKCTSYQLNVVDGKIANQNRLSTKQRIAPARFAHLEHSRPRLWHRHLEYCET